MLQLSEDLNKILPQNARDEPTLGEAQLARLFSHFLTRCPRSGCAHFDPQPTISQFLTDLGCGKLVRSPRAIASQVTFLHAHARSGISSVQHTR